MTGTKTCTRCGVTKKTNDFQKRAASKDGLMSWCKECYSKWASNYYAKNGEKIRQKHKAYNSSERGKELARARSRTKKAKDKRSEYAKTHKEQLKRKYREYYAANKEKIKEKNLRYQKLNKDKVSEWHKKYRETHKSQIAEYQKRYAKENRDKIRDRTNKRLHHDDLFRVKEQTRNMVRYALRSKGHLKTSSTQEILGCSLDDFFLHLKRTWENRYGKPWSGEPFHIDHIIPLATAKTKDEVISLCHYTNLQMLTPSDNMEKHDRLNWK